ncbi:MAG: bacterioferritin [Proteobacteria bacterium]|nr:bacterioferritin [Pseudomonadota bacterium]
MPDTSKTPFLSDVKTLRARAREHMECGAVTAAYGGDVQAAIELLQTVLATELVCVLRYTQHSITAAGLSSNAVKAEFAEHAREEHQHALAVAERISQLGGVPNFDPEGLATRAASEFAEGADLVDMIRENLIAERIAVEHYTELVAYFGDADPTTRAMLERLLAQEEEHADDLCGLLDSHQDRPDVAGG